MKKTTAKITLSLLIAAGLAAVPTLLRADDSGAAAPATPATPAATPATPATPTPPARHSKHGLSFHGTVGSLDTNAMTLTVSSQTFQITSTTKISNNGHPAILADGVAGEPVTGYYKTGEDGKTLDAVTVHFGAAKAKKKKKSEDSDTTATNAPTASGAN